MDKKKTGKFSFKNLLLSRRIRYGTYATVFTVIVLVLVVFANTMIMILEDVYNLRLDLTSSQMYSVGEETRSILASLDQDIKIYTLYQSGSEDQMVLRALDEYKSRSDRIRIANVDPVQNPAFAGKFVRTGSVAPETVGRGNVIVTDANEERFKILAQDDLYEYTYSPSSESSYVSGFNVESAVTSAIKYILDPNVPTLYFLTGHNEISRDYFSTLINSLDFENIQVADLNLSTSTDMPGENDVLFIASPSVDLLEAERERLKTYLENEGKAIFLFDVNDTELAGFFDLLENYYHVTVGKGIVLESNVNYFLSGYPTFILPAYGSHAVVNSIASAGVPTVLMNVRPLTFPSVNDPTLAVTPLLYTSTGAYVKVNLSAATVEKEEGDEDGRQYLALAVEKRNADSAKDPTRLMVAGTANLVRNSAVLSSSANVDLFINAMNWMLNREESITIYAKDLQGGVLLLNGTQGVMLSAIVTILIPLCLLAVGVAVWLRRRHL